jgi:hypothetical protein
MTPKAQMAHDFHPNIENECRKRKRDANRKTTSKKPKKEPVRGYTIILVEGTKVVARDQYAKPNASKYVVNAHAPLCMTDPLADWFHYQMQAT